MPRGSRPGERRGGRRRGTPNKSTVLKYAAICASGSSANSAPLDFLLGLMRDPKLPTDLRVEMAKLAAPFVHERQKVRRFYRPNSVSAGSPRGTGSEQGAGPALRRSSEPSYSSSRKMEGELNGTAAAGGADLSPLDYLLSVMNDADAKPQLRIKAARIAAPYFHAHPMTAKRIVIDDPFGFNFDPELARELRDEEVNCSMKMLVTEFHTYSGSPEAREAYARIYELKQMLPKHRPPGYTLLHARNDWDRTEEFFDVRRERKLTKEEDAEEAHLIARVAVHSMTYAASPECRGRERIYELNCQAALSEAEQHELDELVKLYPDLPGPPDDPVKRAMLEYIEKNDPEAKAARLERERRERNDPIGAANRRFMESFKKFDSNRPQQSPR